MIKSIFYYSIIFFITVVFLFLREKEIIFQNSSDRNISIQLILGDRIIHEESISPGILNAKSLVLRPALFDSKLCFSLLEDSNVFKEKCTRYNSLLHRAIIFDVTIEEEDDTYIFFSKKYVFPPSLQ